MVAIKNRDADSFVARPSPAQPIVLLYGPDAGLVREICSRFAAERGRPMKIIATGGLAALFDQIEDLFDRWDDDLTMHGLRLIHDYNKEMGNG